jgi:hypothetical protein
MHLYLSMQKLTTLNLEKNKMDNKGVQHLANILQHNKVRLVLFSPILYASV